MTVGTARNGRPPQDSANARAFWRAAGLILLFNGLLVGVVLFKPISDATLALVLRWATEVDVGTRILPSAPRECSDEREALGSRLAWFGHPELGIGTGDLHLLRVGAWPAATAALHSRCGIFERISFLTTGHPAASGPPHSSRIPHPHRARWPDDHDGCRHLQLVLHSRACHAARVRDDPSEGCLLSLSAGRYRADRLPDNTRIAS